MNEAEKLLEWTKGNREAADFIGLIAKASQDADDLADDEAKDKEKTAFHLCARLLTATGNNAFFVTYRPQLNAVLMSSLTMWMASNHFGRSENPTTRVFGFVYREVLEQIIPYVALLCGATFEESVFIALDVHHFYHVESQETLQQWEESHG